MTETMTKTQIAAEIDRIGYDVLGYGQHVIFASTSAPKNDLFTILANFRLMEELKRRQQVIADRYEPTFWRKIKCTILRHGANGECADDLKQYWLIERELSRIWNARWTVSQEIAPQTPNPIKEES